MVTAPSSQGSFSRDGDKEKNHASIVGSLLGKLQGIIPIIDRIRQSIRESSASIPRASVQLTSVTQATEVATVEILNVVDSMNQSIAHAESALATLREGHKHAMTFEREFTEQLEASLSSREDNGAVQKLHDLWKHRPLSSVDATQIHAIHDCLAKAREDSMQITLALQVQDITSQQIAGVLHLIETVRLQLVDTLRYAENIEKPEKDTPPVRVSEATAFDMNAQYSKSTDRQATADDIIKQWNAEKNAQQR